ncbi:MAG TPA: hypothetical protein VHX42_04380 [Candidatus Babeliales bacterium]|jgi:hypothetical protein|nr:hypothetical protein [Candidatus Babeliales bacterium]
MLLIKSRVKKYCVAALWLFSSPIIFARGGQEISPEDRKQLKVGNFALPLSQQPAPLFSFGQNLVAQGDFLAFLYVAQLKGKQKSLVEAYPFFLYGITDKLSLVISVPIAAKFQEEQYTSHDFEDLIVELEGIIYLSETSTSVNMISLLGDIAFPTGSTSKTPATGLGSPHFFLGVTLSRTQLDWYYFTCWGGIMTTTHHHSKIGNSLLYQFGVGRNIAYRSDRWLLNWMIELDGTYEQRDKICGVVDCNSGGNTLFLGPSIFFSTQRFEMDIGIQGVVAQHLFGVQSRDSYFAEAYFGWKF